MRTAETGADEVEMLSRIRPLRVMGLGEISAVLHRVLKFVFAVRSSNSFKVSVGGDHARERGFPRVSEDRGSVGVGRKWKMCDSVKYRTCPLHTALVS